MIIDCSSGLGDGTAAIEAAAALSLEVSRSLTLLGNAPKITAALTRTACDAEMIRVVHVETSGGTAPGIERACAEVQARRERVVITASSLASIARLDRQKLPLLPGCPGAAAFMHLPVLRPHGDERVPFALVGDSGLTHSPDGEQLVNFARLGAVYAQTVLERNIPNLALLSVSGDEEDLPPSHKQAHEALSELESDFTYSGLSVPADIFRAEADVLITDGYAGGLVSGLVDSALTAGERLVERSRSGIRKRIGLRALGDVLTRLQHIASVDTYGGVVVLGHEALILAVRPDAEPRAWKNALSLASDWERVKLFAQVAAAYAN